MRHSKSVYSISETTLNVHKLGEDIFTQSYAIESDVACVHIRLGSEASIHQCFYPSTNNEPNIGTECSKFQRSVRGVKHTHTQEQLLFDIIFSWLRELISEVCVCVCIINSIRSRSID